MKSISQAGVCASKTWSISNAGGAPLKGRNVVSKNVHLGGSICAPGTFLFVDESSPNFRPTWKEM